jgi:hypothetical protein
VGGYVEFPTRFTDAGLDGTVRFGVSQSSGVHDTASKSGSAASAGAALTSVTPNVNAANAALKMLRFRIISGTLPAGVS